MDVSDVLSIIAIVVSVIVATITFYSDKKKQRTELESVYFKEIYQKSLIKDIPEARGYIRFDAERKLTGTDKLINELKNILQISRYFLYNDKAFYCQLKETVQQLEDYLVQNTDKSFNPEDEAEIHEEIHRQLEKIYKTISDKYLGKKFKMKKKY